MPYARLEERHVGYRCLICGERDEAADWTSAEGLAETHRRATNHPVEVEGRRAVRFGILSPIAVPST